MRNYLLLYINGKEHRITGETAFISLSNYLRYGIGQPGTKIVCEEGDCGACTVLIGKEHDGKLSYKPVNSCIQFLYQLDLCHIVTVEGLSEHGQLNTVQQAMVECHGAQCGYCTPGFVVALSGLFNERSEHNADKASGNGCSQSLCSKDIKDALTGNLCRCTGYEPIIKAGLEASKQEFNKLSKLYPEKEIASAFKALAPEAVKIEADKRTCFIPATIKECVQFKADNKNTSIVCGGTDTGVSCNKRAFTPETILSLSNVQGMDKLEVKDSMLIVGGKVSLFDLEQFTKDVVPEFHQILNIFGSPQIKHAGTMAGNIANGSPIADTLPFLFVMNALIEFEGINGSRQLNINELYTGYKVLDMTPDEIIARILIPLPAKGDILRLYKVSRRKDLDISAFTAAIYMQTKDSSISQVRIAYGGVAAKVVRMKETEAFLKGKNLTLDTMQEAGKIAKGEVKPITDVRGSADFRLQLCENIMQKFYYEVAEPDLCPA